MKNLMLAAVAVVSLSTGNAFAFQPTTAFSHSRDSGQTFLAPHGTIITTGRVGQLQTTTLPGSAGQGLLVNNGNGMGTIVSPNGAITSVQIPQ